MSIIKLLPENLINQIAAGEVIERPASVVKELVENSLDAGGDKVQIEIKESGKKLIKITDNGKGMGKDDLILSIQRHATSKISTEEDLWKIKSMGFRGEALASIASVSKMIIRSKQSEDLSGNELFTEGGKVIQIKDVGMAKGTEIEIHDLFFNTPARQKYLKLDTTEFSQITYVVQQIALSNPDISFYLSHNGKTVLELPSSSDFKSRISDIFGKTTSEALLPIFYGGTDFEMDGYIGKPLLARSSSKHQYFFVNKRPIQNFLFANGIKQAFHSMLMEHKKPIFFINIKIDTGLIDVNVHPRKLEIRFENEQKILKTIYGATKKALENAVLMPKAVSEVERYMSDSLPEKNQNFENSKFSDADHSKKFIEMPSTQYKNNFSNSGFSSKGSFKPKQSEISEAIKFSKEMLELTKNFQEDAISKGPTDVLNDRVPGFLDETLSVMPLSQVLNSYIVAKNSEGLVLIDQHAAHERVRYEQLLDEFEKKEKSKQSLLIPTQIELSLDEIEIINENIDIFEGLGFELEPFGGKTFIISAIPNVLAQINPEELIRNVIDDLSNAKKQNNLQEKIEQILTYFSCRSAIKFGQKLEMPEMIALVRQLDGLKRPYTCPHGRPSMVALTMEDLGRLFGRK